VEALGTGVDSKWLGQRVWIWNANAEARPSDPYETGTAAEYAAVPCAHVVPLADHVGFDIGACLGIPACTAHYAVFADGPVAGQTILVRGGAGAVGHLAIQFASQAGARVFATVSSEDKAEAARRAGAQVAVNYRTQDVTTAFRDLVPTGFDRVIEVDFGANAANDAALLKQDGIVVSYSSTSRPEPVLPYYPLQQKGAVLRLVTSYRIPEQARQAAIDDISNQLADRRLDIVVAARLPLAEISAAHEHAESGRGLGRMVLVL
jgi:NADPH:quinone reductase-like Zn-dependent oxidoreductase